jgi:O-antigen/teichoic acid export membrane protein
MLNIQSTPGSLKRRVLEAGVWNFSGYGLSQVIRFGSNLVLTRLLAPEMFGIMAIATIVMVGLGLFSDLGVRPVIVRSPRGNDHAFLNTAWVVQIIRGGLLAVVGLGISFIPVVATRVGVVPADSVYADPRLPYVIAVISLNYIIIGFNSTKLHESYRALALSRITLIELVSQTAAVLCMVTWSFFDRSISVLIAGYVCSSLFTMILSHAWLHGTRNRLHWDASAFVEIFHFGKWIFVSSVLTFLVNNGDRLLLGSFVDATLLGVYVIAFTIVSSIQAVLGRIIGGVLFPALSEIVRERPGTLRKTYYRVHTTIAAFAYFCSGTLMIAGQALIGLLYDPRYIQAGWMLEILAATLLAVPLQMAIQSFMALGLPKIQSVVMAFRLAVLYLAMPAGFYFFGLPGALWGNVASQILGVPIIIYYSSRHSLFDLRKEMIPIPAFFLGTGAGKLLALAIGKYHGI